MNTDVKAANNSKWQVLTEENGIGKRLQRRRYVRLDITSLIDMKLLVPPSEENGQCGFIPYTGDIINVSGGGLLIESTEALPENEYIIMELELNGTDKLAGIVGKIKRCESESNSNYLIGIEFCTKEDLQVNCPPEYREMLGENCGSFDDKVSHLLNKYVFSRKVMQRSMGDKK